jgi:thioredoxin-related protein
LEIFSDAELTDFSGEQTRVKTFALEQGVQFAPTILFFDNDGTRLLRLTGYYEPQRFSAVLDYLIDGHHRRQGLGEFLAGRATPTAAAGLPADALFAEPPYALDRSQMPAQRPLLVLFDGAHCTRCARFHDEVLGDEPTRERLAGFDVVRLDAGDAETPVLTPAGERTDPKSWYAELGFTELPALVFFNESGKQVLATDALVLKSRMNNTIGFVTDRAYEQGWNYQRYARSQALKKAAAGAAPDAAPNAP